MRLDGNGLRDAPGGRLRWLARGGGLLLAFLAVLSTGCEAARALPETVALLELVQQGERQTEAQALTLRLQDALVTTGRWSLLHRNRVVDAQSRAGHGVIPCAEAECAAEVGMRLDVPWVLAGTLARNPEGGWEILLIRVRVATRLAVQTENLSFTGDFSDLMDQGVWRVELALSGLSAALRPSFMKQTPESAPEQDARPFHSLAGLGYESGTWIILGTPGPGGKRLGPEGLWEVLHFNGIFARYAHPLGFIGQKVALLAGSRVSVGWATGLEHPDAARSDVTTSQARGHYTLGEVEGQIRVINFPALFGLNYGGYWFRGRVVSLDPFVPGPSVEPWSLELKGERVALALGYSIKDGHLLEILLESRSVKQGAGSRIRSHTEQTGKKPYVRGYSESVSLNWVF